MDKFEKWLNERIKANKKYANIDLSCSDWTNPKAEMYEKILNKYQSFMKL